MINIKEIRKDPGKQNWDYISWYEVLDQEFIIEFSNCVNWIGISRNQKLSEDFIRDFKDKVDWECISKYQKLSEEFIREFQDRVNWLDISRSQKLSEEFIRELQDKVNWYYISEYQKLSERFIRDFQEYVDWGCIKYYQVLSLEFRREFDLDIIKRSWMYWTIDQKKEYIKNNIGYEVVGNKLIAYKTVRNNGYSTYNFQYHYEVGGEYEAHANYNANDICSFGLSAWTKEDALKYYNMGKLFKVEIDLEDLACVTEDGKIRASKIKILEEVDFGKD